ncbi:MAG: hypothetical protein IKN49_03765 [Elusimicrobiaceae bacterium]|nr:hypothetical protein [Elusimicrobiaceae bacterium]
MNKWILILLIIGLMWYMFSPSKQKIKNLGNAHGVIVAFGDSLTYGYGASTQSSYPAVLTRNLGREVINLGRNGETAVHAVTRIQETLDYEPYMVLIEFGANDFMQSVSFERTISAMEQMVEAVQAAGAIAVVVDTGGTPLMNRYSKAYKKIAQEKGAVFVPGILDGIFGRKGLMSDQIHPNATGYRMVAEKIEKEIKPYL